MCGLVVNPKFLDQGVGSSARSTLYFAMCGSYASGIKCWADVVPGCAGAGGSSWESANGAGVGPIGHDAEAGCEGRDNQSGRAELTQNVIAEGESRGNTKRSR
jgi:hypothetical protein